MEIASALDLVHTVVYKPGWEFIATDHTSRFEGTITVKVVYPARNSNRDQADAGYPEEITTYATFPLVVADCDDESLYLQILQAIVKIETHEAREFLRIKPTNWAPFHPHRVDGMRRWHKMMSQPLIDDLQFGIA